MEYRRFGGSRPLIFLGGQQHCTPGDFLCTVKGYESDDGTFLCLLRTDIMAGKHCILGDGKTFDKQNEESINLRIDTRV